MIYRSRSHRPMRQTTLANWFTTDDLGDGVHRVVEPAYRADYRCNIYLIRGSRRDAVIDTGLGFASLRAFLKPLSPDPILIASHAHYDHLGGNDEFPERLGHPAEAGVFAAPTAANTYGEQYLNAADFRPPPWHGFAVDQWQPPAAPLTRLIGEGDTIDLGDRRLRVLHTPGHSWGSFCLWDEPRRAIFSIDTVYDGELFDFLPCSHVPTYVQSMRRLAEMDVRTAYPGHGPVLTGEQFRQIANDYVTQHS